MDKPDYALPHYPFAHCPPFQGVQFFAAGESRCRRNQTRGHWLDSYRRLCIGKISLNRDQSHCHCRGSLFVAAAGQDASDLRDLLIRGLRGFVLLNHQLPAFN